MEKIKLNCTRCGNLFIYERKSSKGKLPAYCEDCKKEMILESKRK